MNTLCWILVCYVLFVIVVLRFLNGCKTQDAEYCSVGAMGEPHLHCTHWYDGEGCCRCDYPAMNHDEKVANFV